MAMTRKRLEEIRDNHDPIVNEKGCLICQLTAEVERLQGIQEKITNAYRQIGLWLKNWEAEEEIADAKWIGHKQGAESAFSQSSDLIKPLIDPNALRQIRRQRDPKGRKKPGG